ncbi:MAG: methyltransferase type 11 [Sulfurimonas sp.]|nr:MAG: methyltransferase type 11 [Sulfurimonas sp.]
MADTKQIIELYSQLAEQPNKDFAWDKGISNAKAHGYLDEWFKILPPEIWDYCAAVGNPFSLGEIKKASTVVDLGCGAGIDLLISALKVGENGKAIGIDITPKMLDKARYHAKLAGLTNVEVIESSFDNIDLADASVDVVISNGAINLTSCKESVFSEVYRILKDDGEIFFADMIDISIDEKSSCPVEEDSYCDTNKENWANCVIGTLRQEKLIKIMQNIGFKYVECTSLTHYFTSKTTQGATFKAKKVSADKLREMHWDNIFKTKDYTQVLWHQNSPIQFLDLINIYANKEDKIIDVGCGTSLIVDNLLKNGYKDIILLDTSKISLEIVKKRVLKNQNLVSFICLDVLNFKSAQRFNIWHDRAVFHFLLQKQEREKYFEVLNDSLISNGYAVISTFLIGSQTECAGLKIVQYDYDKMLKELPSSLKLVSSDEYTHITPKNSEQKYIYFIIKKV